MLLANAPSKLPLPFAGSGNKNSIPEASQIGVTAGAASLADGFPPLCLTPISAGGVAPSGLDMNGILYEATAIARWTNAGGGYKFDGTFAADSNVGGYPQGARVLRSDGLGYWLNTTDNNSNDPEGSTQPSGWLPDKVTGASAVTMTNANITLTPLQWGQPVIIITGTLTTNLNLIFPAIVGNWVVINKTAGAYTITCKTASGTGVSVLGSQEIVGDGTNIYNVSAIANALISTNNLSDVGSLALALGNLTFASDNSSYFKVPNPSLPAKPWIIQVFSFTSPNFGASSGTSSVSFPMSFPNSIKSISLTPTLQANSGSGDNLTCAAVSASTSGFTFRGDTNNTGVTINQTVPVLVTAIGN